MCSCLCAASRLSVAVVNMWLFVCSKLIVCISCYCVAVCCEPSRLSVAVVNMWLFVCSKLIVCISCYCVAVCVQQADCL